MSRWPDDPTSHKPSPKWMGVVAVGLMVVIFAVLGTAGWTGRHHADLIDRFSGTWTESDTDGADSLTIEEEMKTVEIASGDIRETPTGDLTVTGKLNGRPVRGRIVVSGFPPWSSTLEATLGGQHWVFRYDADSVEVTVTGENGRTITFAPTP